MELYFPPALPGDEMKKCRILKECTVEFKKARVGDVLEVRDQTAAHLVQTKLGELADDDAEPSTMPPTVQEPYRHAAVDTARDETAETAETSTAKRRRNK